MTGSDKAIGGYGNVTKGTAPGQGRGARLRPQDWKSDDRFWLFELVAPFATAENKLNEAMLADLVENVFKSEPFKLHVIDPETGKREEKTIGLNKF